MGPQGGGPESPGCRGGSRLLLSVGIGGQARLSSGSNLVSPRRRPCNSKAENQLGYMAENGWGQPQSYNEAFSWYYKAADDGSDEAMENIGYNFQNGIGVAVDYRQARSWLY